MKAVWFVVDEIAWLTPSALLAAVLAAYLLGTGNGITLVG